MNRESANKLTKALGDAEKAIKEIKAFISKPRYYWIYLDFLRLKEKIIIALDESHSEALVREGRNNGISHRG